MTRGAPVEYACVSEIGDRSQNQDRFLALSDSEKDLYLFAVADGMGGHRGGAEAAEAAVNALRELWQEGDYPHDSQDWIRDMFQRANRSVRHLASIAEKSSPQTTLVVMVLNAGEAWSGHVGDSRLIHYSRAGLKGRTRDHSVTEMKLAAGEISEREAAVDPDRNLLTMAVGGAQESEPDIAHWRIVEGDVVCLASDGAWSLLSDEDFSAFATAQSLQEAADEIMQRRLSRAPAGQDNATIALVRT